MENKTIITAALTGASGSKKLNPHTPITPEEIAADAIACYHAGASVVHLHMKADDGESPSMDVEKFKQAQKLIQSACDVIINMTTSGEFQEIDGVNVIASFEKADEKRLGVLNLNPELATFDIPTINFGRSVFLNTMPFLETLGKEMQQRGIKPEVEIFDFGDIAQAKRLINEGYLQEPVHYQFVLGLQGGAPATVGNLAQMVDQIGENNTWSCFGIGVKHLPIVYAGIALGGHIRVGLEDNLYYRKGEYATNIQLVERAVKAIETFGNETATPDEAREILGLNIKQRT